MIATDPVEPVEVEPGDVESFELSEPSAAELAAIEAEAPVIAAEVRVVEAECLLASHPGPIAVRLHRRMVRRLDQVARLVADDAARAARVEVARVLPVRSSRPAAAPSWPAAA
ncbi:hypothetical protein GCM10027059_48440 [Myceligenerans halotolerans]